MKEYIEERAVQIANYIIDENATVRQTAKKFGISKSTVHTAVTNWTLFFCPGHFFSYYIIKNRTKKVSRTSFLGFY